MRLPQRVPHVDSSGSHKIIARKIATFNEINHYLTACQLIYIHMKLLSGWMVLPGNITIMNNLIS